MKQPSIELMWDNHGTTKYVQFSAKKLLKNSRHQDARTTTHSKLQSMTHTQSAQYSIVGSTSQVTETTDSLQQHSTHLRQTRQEYHLVVQSVMERWRGILKVPLFPGSRGHYKVAASLCISTSSQSPSVPSMNAIFFNGDRVQGTGNPVIERLSDLERIAEVIVSKLGENVNAWVIEASKFNGPFAVYKDFIPSVNKWGEPNSYDPTGFPASSSTVSLLSNCLDEVKNTLSTGLEEHSLSEAARSSCFSQPNTILFGFSKGGSVLNQLVTELAFSEIKPAISSQDKNEIIPTSKESLLNSITEIHYVDVGLNTSGAYITDKDIITRISKVISERPLGIRFVLHGTPRQWRDSMRVWIGKEKDTMVHLLDTESQKSEGKLSVCERFYFANKPANMQMHFEVIESMDIS